MKRTATKTITKKQVWSWKDDYRVELTTKDSSELIALDKTYSNLNSHVASERVLEQATMIRCELNRRNAGAERMFQEAGLA